MDRNRILPLSGLLCCVALRKESVDRNMPRKNLINSICLSLSARRAWIEIIVGVLATLVTAGSLSARRAWIEITSSIVVPPKADKSLSARRAWIEIFTRKTFAYVS